VSQLYLPPSARNEIDRDRAEIMQQYMQVKGTLDHFNRELREIDDRLKMVIANDHVADDSPLKAGYYHILLEAPGHPTTVLPLEYDNGEYREPGSWIFPYLEEQDMWNDRVRRAGRERQRKLSEARDRQSAREAADRAAEFNARWKSANSLSVLIPRGLER
jgi:hypothetical protein